jgi:hypothetical protein
MRKWWWWWLPGWRAKWKLETSRMETLSSITGDQLRVELMAQRPRRADDVLDNILLETVLKRLKEIEESAKQATETDDLDDLVEDAELQGQFTGYICPATEIQDEGELTVDLIEGWGVPKAAINKLRESLGKKLEKADTNPLEARGALYHLFQERDAWADYRDDYEDTMQNYTWKLFGATIILPALAIIAFHFAFRFSPLLLLGLLFASAAGSCVSVMAKMPALDVSLSGELDAYGRRILSRIGIGVVASLIGCALLGWGVFPISIQNLTFADGLNACTTSATACAGVMPLVLLGVPMLFGFSERALTSFEQRVFGNSPKSPKG